MFDVRFSPPLLVLPVVFMVFWSGFIIFLDWLFVTRREAVKKHLPITSNEWRRRQKRFYDNLPR